MLGSGKVGRAVVDFLKEAGLPNIVVDPIIKSSSGHDLIDPAGLRILVDLLLPLATVITPNVDEAAALTGLAVTNLEQMRVAAATTPRDGCCQRGHHWRPPRKGNRPVELHQPEGRRSRRSSNLTGYGPTLPMARAAPSPRRWPAIWRGAADYPRPCCWRRPTWQRRLPTRILWDGATGRCITCIACISSVGL